MELLQEIEIKNFVTKIKISESRRAKYFKLDKKKHLPIKYLNKSIYDYKQHKIFNKVSFYLTNIKTNEIVIANNKSVGTPKYISINAQNFYAGISNFARVKLVTGLKKFYSNNMPELKIINQFPIHINYIFYVVNNREFDADNISWVYIKVFHDWLRHKNIIPNDDIKYISGYTVKIEIIENIEDRKLQIQFFKK